MKRINIVSGVRHTIKNTIFLFYFLSNFNEIWKKWKLNLEKPQHSLYLHKKFQNFFTKCNFGFGIPIRDDFSYCKEVYLKIWTSN
jgi:hypothetical protein